MNSCFRFHRLSLGIALLCTCLAAPLHAGKVYLKPGKPNGLELLPPPPPPGSPEETADLDVVRSVHNSRIADADAKAVAEGDFDIFVFAPAIGPFFQPDLPKTKAFFEEISGEVEVIAKQLKNIYKRPRPCDIDPSLQEGPAPRSYGYPSRHATLGTVDAMILIKLFPKKQDAIFSLGRSLGWHRVILGRHYPTDIFAGRVLGRAIYHELLKSETFKGNLAEVAAELKAANSSTSTKHDIKASSVN
ncbi:MAG: phosphatase PAP2 family protein [Chthoniobacterales bacterium]